MKLIPPNITPGEWAHRARPAINGDPYCFVQTGRGAFDITSPSCMIDESEPNARAIAALPKLLKALEDELAVLIDYRDRALALMPEKTLFFSRIESIKSALIAAGYTEVAG